ncbi:MAG: shikimate dehydrogenase family protein [Bacteroidales bacterium]
MHNKVFGLIGNPIKHSLSKAYFEKKFSTLHLYEYKYELFELQSVRELTKLLGKEPNLCGFNVTSPFKVSILDYLDSITQDAFSIGAVNTVKISKGKLIGYNTDWIGFFRSLQSQVDVASIRSALILGTGGAAKSIAHAFKIHNINYIFATTKASFNSKEIVSYSVLNRFENFDMIDIIINATPCGMETYPPIANIDTRKITSKHIVFDLIYNPEETMLLKISKNQGAKIINGLQMLHNQAEESWKIFNSL